MFRGTKAMLALSALLAWNVGLAQSDAPTKPTQQNPVQVAQAPAAGGAATGAAAGTAGGIAGIGAGTMAAAFGLAVAAVAVAGGGGSTVSHFATTHNPSK